MVSVSAQDGCRRARRGVVLTAEHRRARAADRVAGPGHDSAVAGERLAVPDDEVVRAGLRPRVRVIADDHVAQAVDRRAGAAGAALDLQVQAGQQQRVAGAGDAGQRRLQGADLALERRHLVLKRRDRGRVGFLSRRSGRSLLAGRPDGSDCARRSGRPGCAGGPGRARVPVGAGRAGCPGGARAPGAPAAPWAPNSIDCPPCLHFAVGATTCSTPSAATQPCSSPLAPTRAAWAAAVPVSRIRLAIAIAQRTRNVRHMSNSLVRAARRPRSAMSGLSCIFAGAASGRHPRAGGGCGAGRARVGTLWRWGCGGLFGVWAVKSPTPQRLGTPYLRTFDFTGSGLHAGCSDWLDPWPRCLVGSRRCDGGARACLGCGCRMAEGTDRSRRRGGSGGAEGAL